MSRPTKYPRWATDGGTTTEPMESEKDSGWVTAQKPSAQEMNWLQNNAYQWLAYLDSILGSVIFGDGFDGDVTLSDAGTHTLTRDMYYDNLTISGGTKLKPAGFRIFVKGTLTLATSSDIILNNGEDGSGGGTGGAAGASGKPLGYGEAGGNGGVAANGDPGTDIAASIGAGGGAGGAFSPHTGGAGGSVTSPGAANGGFRSLYTYTTGWIIGNAGTTQILGGAGGGGGAGSGGNGGGGGAGGGVVLVCANTINSAGKIQANGGAGGAAAAGDGAGGGGGGGVVLLAYHVATALGTVQAAGGVAGVSGSGGGANGVTGGTGAVLEFAL